MLTNEMVAMARQLLSDPRGRFKLKSKLGIRPKDGTDINPTREWKLCYFEDMAELFEYCMSVEEFAKWAGDVARVELASRRIQESNNNLHNQEYSQEMLDFLSNHELHDLNLQYSFLQYMELTDVQFHNCNFTGCFLNSTFLTRSQFHNCNLKGTNFTEASLYEGICVDSDTRGAQFRYANLAGADMEGARSLEKAELGQAYYLGNTKWPEGFDPVAAGAILI